MYPCYWSDSDSQGSAAARKWFQNPIEQTSRSRAIDYATRETQQTPTTQTVVCRADQHVNRFQLLPTLTVCFRMNCCSHEGWMNGFSHPCEIVPFVASAESMVLEMMLQGPVHIPRGLVLSGFTRQSFKYIWKNIIERGNLPPPSLNCAHSIWTAPKDNTAEQYLCIIYDKNVILESSIFTKQCSETRCIW